MRLIDADAFDERVRVAGGMSEEELTEDFKDGVQAVLYMLSNQPTIQPEIIRCKDCKHWREGTAFSYCDKLYEMGVLDALDYMVAEDDYCSMAERRTDGTD